MSRYLLRIIITLGLIIGVCMPFLLQASHAQDDTSTVEITVEEVNASFPQIELTVSVLNQGRAVSGLTADDFIIGEPFRDLTVEEVGEASTLAVVIDIPTQLLGQELQRVLEPVRLYFNTPDNYQDGTPVIFVLQYQQRYLPQTVSSLSEINDFLDDVPTSGDGFNFYEEGLESAAAALTEFIGENGGTGNILIVGAFSQRGNTDLANTAQLAGTLFQEFGYTTSVIHAFTGSRQQFSPNFESIATQGNGAFAVFNASATRLDLEPVFTQIQAEQSSYRLVYETLNGESGVQTVTISVETDAVSGSTTFEYPGPNLLDPVVTVRGISNNETIIRAEDSSGTFSSPSRSITVDVSFPDSFERDVSEVLLIISSQGEIVDEVSVASPDSLPVEIEWDLSSIVPAAGETSLLQPFTLAVNVIDQYGRIGDSNPINVSVQAEALPEPVGEVSPTPTLPPTEAPTATIDISGLAEEDINATTTAIVEQAQATQTAVAAAILDTTSGSGDSSSSDGPPIPLIIGGIVAVLIVLAGVGLLLTRRSPQPVPVAAVGGAPNLDMMKTQVGGVSLSAAASLEVLTGVETGQQIQLNADYFTIGREAKQGINYATPSYDNVSSRHCSIIQRGNDFLVVDHGSTNGTYLNGTQLNPNIEVPLPPNATLQLGKDPHSSIQLRFKIAGVGGGDMGKTRIDAGPAPVDNAVWGKKTQMYGQNNPPAPPPAAPSPPAAAPGQFFNQGQQQRPPAPPPPPQPGYGQQKPRNYESDWSGGGNKDDSWLDQ